MLDLVANLDRTWRVFCESFGCKRLDENAWIAAGRTARRTNILGYDGHRRWSYACNFGRGVGANSSDGLANPVRLTVVRNGTRAYREVVELPGLHSYFAIWPLVEIAWHDSEALEMVSGRNKVIDEILR